MSELKNQRVLYEAKKKSKNFPPRISQIGIFDFYNGIRNLTEIYKVRWNILDERFCQTILETFLHELNVNEAVNKRTDCHLFNNSNFFFFFFSFLNFSCFLSQLTRVITFYDGVKRVSERKIRLSLLKYFFYLITDLLISFLKGVDSTQGWLKTYFRISWNFKWS